MDRSAASELLLRQRLRALEKNLPAAAKGNRDALHHARVASRRIREALPLLSAGDRARRLERKVRKITQALGPVRELDVALEILDEIEARGEAPRAALARLRQAVAREREVLQAEMRRRLDACDLDTLRKRALGVARRHGHDKTRASRDPEQLLRAHARAARRAERLRTAIRNAGSLYLPDRLHDVRIALKKLRYSLEILRQLGGVRTPARLKTLSRVQDTLGRMHDLEVLIARARGVQGSPGALNLRLSGELDRVVRRFETECRQLHGQYMTLRRSVLDICEQTVAAARASAAA